MLPMSNVEGADVRREFGQAVRTARERRGITQEQLAHEVESLGLSRFTIAKIEAGSRPTPVEDVLAIARALQVPPSALLGEDTDAETLDAAQAVHEAMRLQDKLVRAAWEVERAAEHVRALPPAVTARLAKREAGLLGPAGWGAAEVVARYAAHRPADG